MTAPSRPRGADTFDVPELDRAIEDAQREALVVWRGQAIAFLELPMRIARTDPREERDGMYAGWIEALESLNPLYEERLAEWESRVAATGSDDPAAAMAGNRELGALAGDLDRLALHTEAVYHAALRRYLALIDLEQGDATLADAWHMVRGAAWNHWFGDRELERAAAEVGRAIAPGAGGQGWASAEVRMGGDEASAAMPRSAIGEIYGSLVGDPSWLRRALRMAPDEVASFADFVAFVRLWRIRRMLATTLYEMRLYRTGDPALRRAYFAGIVGHSTGISVPEAAYLHDVGTPFSSAGHLERMMLAGTIAEVVEHRFGPNWWADPQARELLGALARASSTEDALAQLGYDALDWRPVVRQIRTRLIGEMSGYGGPNITTRAGTRKV
jgi:hypothetical protein